MLAACGVDRAEPISLAEVQGPHVWGSAGNVVRVRHLWLSGQPNQAGLEAARAAGVTVVLDLREPGERDWNEAEAATRAGLAYRNIAVGRSGPFSKETFAEIEAFVAAHRGAEVMIHCSSGNRAAAWLTTHLVEKHGLSYPDALEIGRRAGITAPAIIDRTAAYLGEATPPDDAN